MLLLVLIGMAEADVMGGGVGGDGEMADGVAMEVGIIKSSIFM